MKYLPDEIHAAFHKVWTWAVDHPGYEKDKFLDMELHICTLARQADEANSIRQSVQESIEVWEHQYCQASFAGEQTYHCVVMLRELYKCLGETWTPEGIFQRVEARRILADLRRSK